MHIWFFILCVSATKTGWYLFKVFAVVADCCVFPQINKEDGNVEASRIMNLYQFLQLYKDITSQASEVMSVEMATGGSSGEPSSEDTCQASMWMGR